MRRRLLIIVCCLVAGAVLNTIVAWSCALWSGPNTLADVEIIKFDPDVHRWIAEHVGLIDPNIHGDVGNTYSFGRSVRIAQAYLDASTFESGIVVYDYASVSWLPGELQHVRAGWPCLAFEGGRGESSGIRALRSYQVVDAVEITMDQGPSLLTKKFPRMVPLAPIWSGFIINTLFYAALIWCVTAGPFVMRRALRKRRGRCLECAYPIGEGDVCTECGEATAGVSPTAREL